MQNIANRTVVRLKDFRAADVGDGVSKVVTSLTDQVADGVQEWRSKALSTARSADGLVRSRPWQTVGPIALVGVAAGMAVSLGTRRASRREREVNEAS